MRVKVAALAAPRTAAYSSSDTSDSSDWKKRLRSTWKWEEVFDSLLFTIRIPWNMQGIGTSWPKTWKTIIHSSKIDDIQLDNKYWPWPYIYIYTYHIYIYIQIYIYIYIYTYTPSRLLFREGPYQNVRYILWEPHLKCKIGRWQVSFLWGGSSKYLQNESLHVQGPHQKHLEKCSLHFGYVPP